MNTATKTNTDTPFHRAFNETMEAGWPVIPLPLGAKFPPPKGTTGANGSPMDEEGMWSEMDKRKKVNGEWRNMGNIGITMPTTVIGIDVDGQEGFQLLMELSEKLGESLPLEMMITSHNAITEGFTAFFTIPEGLLWRSSAGDRKGIDIIRHNHRYSVVAPSVHPSGRVYRWVNAAGHTLPFVPEVEWLSPLPEAWIKELTIKEAETTKSYRTDEERSELQVPQAQLDSQRVCAYMKSILFKRLNALECLPTGRHDLMVRATWAMINEASHGHRGAAAALSAYRGQWLKLFPEEDQKQRAIDFENAVNSAQAKVGNTAAPCICHGSAQPKKKKVVHRVDRHAGIIANTAQWRGR